MAQSRTGKSMKNIIVAFSFLGVNMILQFFVRKIFLDYLGTEILGLNTTANNLLQFLNLAELGIGSAVSFSLYKPIFEGDRDAINEIVSLQGHLYRRIAYVIIGAALVLSAFFPLIFSKMQLPLWYAYATFGVLLISSLLSYFVNYKQILLSADQKEYKIYYSYKLFTISRLVVQIFAVKYSSHPYIWWLITEGGFNIMASIALNVTVKNTYPYLRTNVSNIKELARKYAEVVKKVKQVFFHKISTFVFMQTTPLIIYAFANLTAAALYGNYQGIFVASSVMFGSISFTVISAVGNLIAEGNKDKILNVFSETLSGAYFISGVLMFVIYQITTPFISHWIGDEYILSQEVLIIMTLTVFIQQSSRTVENFLAGYGMYQDIWAPVTEAALSIGMSIFFGILWDLEGILLGVLVSKFMMMFVWKPYFLFRWGMKESVWVYMKDFLRNIFAIGISIAIFLGLIVPMISVNPYESVGSFVVYCMIVLPVYALLAYVSFMLLCPGMRGMSRRIKHLIVHRS